MKNLIILFMLISVTTMAQDSDDMPLKAAEMRGKDGNKLLFKSVSMTTKDGLYIDHADSLLLDKETDKYIFYGVDFFKFKGKIIIAPNSTGTTLVYCKYEDFITIE